MNPPTIHPLKSSPDEGGVSSTGGQESLIGADLMTEAEKIEATVINMDGEALAWFQWEVGRRPMWTWGKVKANLVDCFGLTQEGSVCEKFLVIGQEGTI
ncbi:hypothetical protein TIFTF001_033602 [Ficus carica]|uniref:Uncharacterized protein n=1 Tax=Ficus carica TaxID=3494 RepID=A0AA88DZK3_FICCA|nr:hypothetical protein TIFTF001_033602 [Ficus carica]